jgi:DNA-binding MarR family transcriptional regulator
MARLSESQLVVLNAACKRDNRSVYPLTIKVPAGAVQKILNSLLSKGLIEEVHAKREDEVWREDKDGQRLTLRATSAADAALGIDESAEAPKAAEPAPVKGKKKGRSAKKREKSKAPRAPRTDTKQARLIEMLKRSKGATIEEIAKDLDWQPHTVRGAIAGALKKKLKLDVTSEKFDGRGRVYRVAA